MNSSVSINLKSLRQRVFHAGAWTLLGHGGNQLLRFIGNLILTRLLFPEAFGLMAIVQAVLFGVNMLSDIGIGPAIVQDKHGNNETFLNTAWTIQVVRGFFIWIVICSIAYPVSLIYKDSLLYWLLPAVGFVAVIEGFMPTKAHIANRNLNAKVISMLELFSYAAGLLCVIVFAYLFRSVWSLVLGGLVTALTRNIGISLLFEGMKNRFVWDMDVAKKLLRFGAWVFLSSTLTFLSTEIVRLYIGAVLDMQFLAFFSLANALVLMYLQLAQQVSGRVFFPAISEKYRVSPEHVDKIVFKLRILVVIPGWFLALIFIFYGQHIIDVLYDSRYQDAGGILKILSSGMLAGCIGGSYYGILMAVGRIRAHTLNTINQVIIQSLCIYFGYELYGADGLIKGLALSYWIVSLSQAIIMRINGFSQWRFDAILLAISLPFLSFAF